MENLFQPRINALDLEDNPDKQLCSQNDDGCTSMEKSDEIEMSEMGYSVTEIVDMQPTSDPDHPDNVSRLNSSAGSCFDHQTDDEDVMLIPTRPSKSQVLHYFSKAYKFKIRRVERDIQITDSDGFPLFDAYADVDCVGRIWTLESYGKMVLFMREYAGNDWCHHSLGASRVSIRDWNGDFFGEFLAGDPFYLNGVDKRVVAKISKHAPDENRTDESGFSSKSQSWICVDEENGKHIARLDDYQSVQFNKDVAFHLKLLSLAAIVRLVGQTGLMPTSKCVGVVKTILNCCAAY